ncbi:MAG: four helix bundle protein [Candidatus Omnitrophica bacterium]|nr:four helix bundle protein [Candidatus Omnitrophota bacterium]MBU4479641.1 four helix bundle protein [Candidatus Omnitrophota bacterium]MCG2703530.1 four helix bundle protein [Candidatus Omnitrophota bacterium]
MDNKKRPYENLRFYQNICEIRRLTYKITQQFDKINFKLIAQMRDAARSAKQNIQEGYQKDTFGEFSHGIKISRGSLKELEGDIDDCYEDGLITEKEYKTLKDLFGKTNFQIDRYLDALYKLEKEGKWKKRFK